MGHLHFLSGVFSLISDFIIHHTRSQLCLTSRPFMWKSFNIGRTQTRDLLVLSCPQVQATCTIDDIVRTYCIIYACTNNSTLRSNWPTWSFVQFDYLFRRYSSFSPQKTLMIVHWWRLLSVLKLVSQARPNQPQPAPARIAFSITPCVILKAIRWG